MFSFISNFKLFMKSSICFVESSTYLSFTLTSKVVFVFNDNVLSFLSFFSIFSIVFEYASFIPLKNKFFGVNTKNLTINRAINIKANTIATIINAFLLFLGLTDGSTTPTVSLFAIIG